MFKIRVMISGDVQDVWFSVSSQDKANELGLSGYVKNLFTNALEIVAEGNRDDLAVFSAWLHEGPPNATIDKISIEWEELPQRQFSSFEIQK